MNQDNSQQSYEDIMRTRRLAAALQASEARWEQLAAWLERKIEEADSQTRENKQLVKLQVESVAMKKVLQRMRG